MKCSICGKTKGYFDERNQEISIIYRTILNEIDELIKMKTKEYAEKNGFSEESKKLINLIRNEYLSMSITSIIDNLQSFLKLDQNIEILVSYYRKSTKKTKLQTLEDVRNKYLEEPITSSISSLQYVFEQKENIERYLSSVSDGPKYFEIQLSPESLGYGNLPSRYMKNEDQQKIMNALKTKISICPVCNAVLKKVSEAAYAATESDDDWDD